jgi:hypothetical protein
MGIQKHLIAFIVLFSTFECIYADNYMPLSLPPTLIKAELANNLESGAVSPVIGVVSEDVTLDGKTLIPVHSEIHGTSQAQTFHDRIACNQEFIIVCPEHRFLAQGVVLDRDSDDKSYGLKGVPVDLYGGFVRVNAGHKFYLYVQTISMIEPNAAAVPRISQ